MSEDFWGSITLPSGGHVKDIWLPPEDRLVEAQGVLNGRSPLFFKSGEHPWIAVKVVDFRSNEVVRVEQFGKSTSDSIQKRKWGQT